MRLQLRIALAQQVLIALIQLQCLLQGEEVLRAPIAVQRPRDFRFAVLAVAVAQLG